jgi:hypothetical protein
MGHWHLKIVASVLIGIAIISCGASAVVMPVDTYRISLEKDGTPYDVFADFSAVCYGHSFLNVAGDTHFLNITPENREPLNMVLDLQVQCNPSDRCTAQTYGKGDPERSEWCELNGYTTGGDPIQANITAENLKVNCSGGEYPTSYRRCNAEAMAKNPCDDLLGSKKLHCTDSQREDVAACLASINGSEDRSLDKWCEIRFNLPSSGIAGPDPVRPANISAQPAAITVPSWSSFVSLYCSILNFFGVQCS